MSLTFIPEDQYIRVFPEDVPKDVSIGDKITIEGRPTTDVILVDYDYAKDVFYAKPVETT
jgi:hypothetical protein